MALFQKQLIISDDSRNLKIEETWKNSTSLELTVAANESVTVKKVDCSTSVGLNCSDKYRKQSESNTTMYLKIVLHDLNPAELHTITLTLETDLGKKFVKDVLVCMGKYNNSINQWAV